MQAADVLLHGSGPALCGEREVARFHEPMPHKPWGAIGVTLQTPAPHTPAVLNTAEFLYTRETLSIEHLRNAGMTKRIIGFAPDATFAHDLLDDARAEQYLRSAGL